MPVDQNPTTTERFAEVLGATGGRVEAVSSPRQVARIIAEAAAERGLRRVLYEPDDVIDGLQLKFPLAAQGVDLVPVRDAGEEAPRMYVGLTGAELAIAATGTLLVGGRPGGWGLASILPWVHLVVMRAEDIVDDLPTAFGRFEKRLREGERDWVWITGPSRTADIGHTLVLGAHGPNQLVVMVLA